MTKNISTKGHRGGHGKPAEHKKSQQLNSNATNQAQHNENAATNAAVIVVQKASIDLKMLTPEQRRLASLMNDKVDVSEIEKKINKIMELTGSSKDKAIVALHDCANELDKAIDMILEGDSINESEWKSQARKKKPKTVAPGTTGKDSVHLNGDAKKGQTGKGRQIRGKGPQLSQINSADKQQQTNNKSERVPGSRRTGDWKSNRETNADDTSTALKSNKDDLDDKLDEWTDEPRERRDRSSNENQFKSHNKYQNTQEGGERRRMPRDGPRDGRRDGNFSRSSNQFGQSERNGQRSGNPTDRMERRPYQNKSYTKKPGGYSNSIDTWSNQTADNTSSSNNYAQMTVGNWSDVVSSNATSVQQQQQQQSDLNNDDWAEASDGTNNQLSSAIETTTTKVFSSKENQNVTSTTQSKSDDHQLSKMPNLASIVSGQVKTTSSVQQPTQNVHKSPSQPPQQQQQTNASSKPSQPTQQQILSNSNNQQSILNKSSPQQNKIDLTALLKSSQQPQQQQPTNNNLMNRGNIQQQQQQQRNNQPDSNTYGAALLQRLQQRITDTDSSLNKGSNLNDYVNPYNQNKSQLVHNIPTNNYPQQNAPTNLFDNQAHHLHHQNVADQKSLMEKKRRQTKIPETAVEMCGMPTSEHISSLNVQFGALDFNNSSAVDYGLNDDQHSQMASKQSQFNLNRDSNNEKTNSGSLLSTVRGNQGPDNKQQSKDSQSLLQNIDHHHHSAHQQLQDNILQQHDSRNKSQQQSTGGYQLNTGYNKNDTSNQHSIYPPNLQNYQSSYGSVNNYGSQNHNSSHNSNTNATAGSNTNTAGASNQQQQKINLKDLSDNSSSTNNQNQSGSNNNSGSALGNLVNNTTVTTNVLKNSLTATGKTTAGMGGNVQQQMNVAPPLLGTPQYIMNMSQPGLSTAFYPVYDMPMPTDHSFRYNQNTQDVKYNRSDAQDGQSNHGNPVQSTQAPVTQTPNHQIFGHLPPYFFYTGVNMMTQGLYQTAAPFLPVPQNPSGNVNQPPHAPNTNQPHSTSFGHSGPKGGQNQAPYGSASYGSTTGYDTITSHQLSQGQDFNKQNYSSGPPNSNQQQQSGKQMSTGGTNDLVNNNMYTKSHAQLTKNFDKQNAFQTGTPPPFGHIATLGYNPNQFITMMQPQSNPSMLHTLQGDGNQNSGVSGNQRGSQSQKNSASNSKTYYNWS